MLWATLCLLVSVNKQGLSQLSRILAKIQINIKMCHVSHVTCHMSTVAFQGREGFNKKHTFIHTLWISVSPSSPLFYFGGFYYYNNKFY